MLDAVLMVVIVVDTTSTPNSAANANVQIPLFKALVEVLNGKETTIVMMVIILICMISEYLFIQFFLDNNNAGCNWDGGDCCGDNVNTQFCSECQCI